MLGVARLGLVDYAAALELQNAAVAARMRDEIGDTLILLEHPPVYTLGRGADASYILDPPAEVPIYRVGRGGQVTFHGPGQLVGYPIVKLTGVRRDGMTGVWAGPRKIGSIGVGIRRWVTLHGFALNVTTDLGYFDAIVPCGIEGCRMTSVAALGNSQVTVAEFADSFERCFATVFEYGQVRRMSVEDLEDKREVVKERGTDSLLGS